jgi:hypothetical protein
VIPASLPGGRLRGSSTGAAFALALSGCTSLAPPTSRPAAADPPHDVTFEFACNQVVVPVTIQNSGPHACLVDTGANPSVIDAALVRRLHLPLGDKTGSAEGIGSGPGKVYFRHGSKSEPGTSEDLRDFLVREKG